LKIDRFFLFFELGCSGINKYKEFVMKRFLFLTLAALVLLFAQKMWAQLDFDPEVIWESKSPVTFNILKFSPDDRYFYTRNDEGIHKFNSENGEYMGLYVEGYFNDFAFVEENNWLVCASLVGLEIRDINTGAILKVLSQDTGTLHFDISQDNKSLVFTQGSKLVDGNYIPLNMYVYSLPDLQEIAVAKGVLTIDNKFINKNEIAVAIRDADNYEFHVFSIPQNKYIRKLTEINIPQYGMLNLMSMSPDYKNLITVNSTSVNFYNIETGELVNKIASSQAYYIGFNPTGRIYSFSDFNRNSLCNFENHREIFMIKNDIFSLLVFLNLDNTKILSNKFGKLKMLRFDFDSLATGVEIKEDIPVIYPNPTMGYVMIPNDGNNILKITISDYTGRDFPAIYTMETGEKTNSIRLNLTIIPSGTYFCNITGQNLSKTLKIILEK
jgi:WD40 repeat protein